MKRQTDLQLIGYISKYGCFFMCIAYWINWKANKIEPDYDYLNRLWMEAIKRGFISGDMNGDGDMDDANELLLLDKNGLLSLCGIKLKYREAVDAGNFKPRAGAYYIGEFYNPKTRFTHFAVINEKKECVYDPIKGSITVRDGYIKTIRVIS